MLIPSLLYNFITTSFTKIHKNYIFKSILLNLLYKLHFCYSHSSSKLYLYLYITYKDNHFYLRKLAELTRCFMETSPEIPILRALTNYYEDSWLLKHVQRLKGKMERKYRVLAGLCRYLQTCVDIYRPV